MKNRLLNKKINLLMTKHSRFHSDFLPVENSLTDKEIRDKDHFSEKPATGD